MTGPDRLVRECRVDRAGDGRLELVFEGPGSRADSSGERCAGGACGLCRAGSRRSVSLVAGSGDAAAATGVGASDRMELSIATAGLRAIAVRAFGVPLAGLVAGAAVGQFIGGEVASIAFGTAGLGGALVWLRSHGSALVALLELELRARPPVASRAVAIQTLATQSSRRQQTDARR